MPNIELVVGDWSFDGHEKTARFVIDSSLELTDLLKAYKKGCEKVGFDLSKSVADEYEDSIITEKQLNAIKGDIPFPKVITKWYAFEKKYNSKKHEYCISLDVFAALWCHVAKRGNPDFSYRFIENKDVINIGGYGLFY
jgi:hypothetical protein